MTIPASADQPRHAGCAVSHSRAICVLALLPIASGLAARRKHGVYRLLAAKGVSPNRPPITFDR
jgi:hypothetical protein